MMPSILTLNINHDGAKHGAWPMRRRLIADAIARARPDVIALQAVRADAGWAPPGNQARELQTLLPDYTHALFEPAHRHDEARADGLAFLSRLPVLDAGCLRLSAVANDEDLAQRIVLHARFALPDGGRLTVANGHFSWVPAVNRENTEETLAYLRGLAAPVVFVGDLNAHPDTETMHRIAAEGWTDSWAHLRQGEPGYTFEAGDATQRIDYIWLDGELRERARAIDIVEAPPGAIRLSDHTGLLLTLA